MIWTNAHAAVCGGRRDLVQRDVGKEASKDRVGLLQHEAERLDRHVALHAPRKLPSEGRSWNTEIPGPDLLCTPPANTLQRGVEGTSYDLKFWFLICFAHPPHTTFRGALVQHRKSGFLNIPWKNLERVTEPQIPRNRQREQGNISDFEDTSLTGGG